MSPDPVNPEQRVKPEPRVKRGQSVRAEQRVKRGQSVKPEQRWATKEVVVIGAGSSGTAAAHLLLDCGAAVTVTDLRPAEELPGVQELAARGATLACGGHPDSLWADKHAAIISPGIDPGASAAEAARAHGVPVVAEIELAAPFLDVPAIAITGSNGKSTVTSMAGSILEAGGMKPAVCGNIGVALSAALRRRLQGRAQWDAYVVELSSFQCEAIDEFRPHVAAILNLTPDHLDRHGSFDRYADAKLRLVKNCTADDTLVYNADDAEIVLRLASTPVRRVPFWRRPTGAPQLDARRDPQPGGRSAGSAARPTATLTGAADDEGASPAAWVDHDTLWWRTEGGEELRLMPLSDLDVIGPHNQENACAAAAIGMLAGVSGDAVAQGLRHYRPLEHRMEACGEIHGVRCINDSKATNVDATIAALSGFEHGVWLILGGRDKGAAFEQLRPLVADRVARVLLVGEASSRIATALAGAVPLERCGTIETALSAALSSAPRGDVLLLSPACTSFDQYASFEARGRHFKELVTAESGWRESRGKPREGGG